MGKSNHCGHPKHSNIQNQEGSREQKGQDSQHAETETKKDTVETGTDNQRKTRENRGVTQREEESRKKAKLRTKT
jgi:hypothetical protein